MFNRTRAFFSYFAATAALALAGPSAPPVNRIIEPIPNTSRKRARGLFNNLPYAARPVFAGKSSLRVSVAQGKRLAAKRRNQLRNKRHLKG
jgi:hypothetical protein